MQSDRPERGRNLALFVAIVALVAVLGALALQVAGLSPAATAGSPGASAPVSPSPSPWPSTMPVPSPAPGRTVVCRAEAGPLPSALATDPCPSAILAVELAVAPVRLAIQRIVVEPGPYYCDVIWPGAASPPPCYASFARPGQYMHAWVAFAGSTRVAVVALGLNLPADLTAPEATRPPWSTTLVAVEDPPATWLMP